MKRKNRSGIVMLVVSLLVVSLAGGGCARNRWSPIDHLPGEQYLVGGGLTIKWEAPEPGTAYLVERQTGKIVETHTLAAGEAYTFSVTSITQAEEFEELLGIDFSRTRFLLYFEPVKPAGPIP